jgi:hypothetical protein
MLTYADLASKCAGALDMLNLRKVDPYADVC